MKKVLIAENAEKAEAFVNELENKYLTALRQIVVKVEALGLAAPDRGSLLDLINGKFEAIRSEFWKIAQPDCESFKSQPLREQARFAAEKSLQELLRSIPEMFSQTIDGISLRDESFQAFIELDESGQPFISDPVREEIRESFREYISSAKIIRVHQAQEQASKSLQELIDSLASAKMDVELYHSRQMFLMSLFKLEAIRDEESDLVIGFKISPQKLNYNLEN